MRNYSSKTGSRCQSRKTTILKRFLKGIFKGKSSLPKSTKSAAKTPFPSLTPLLQCDWQRSAEKHNSITHAAATTKDTWYNHSTAICRYWVAKHNRIAHIGSTNCNDLQLQNRISTPKRKNDDFKALLKENFKKKIIFAKIGKICCHNPIPTFHAAILLRFATLSPKIQ